MGAGIGRPARVDVRFSAAARDLVWAVCRKGHGSVVYIHAPGRALSVPSPLFRPGPDDVVIGRLGCAPVWLNRCGLGWFIGHRMVLDVGPEPALSHGEARLSTRMIPLRRDLVDPSGTAAVTGVLVDELIRRLGPVVSHARVHRYVCRALAQLEGSVSVEMLPEMAARLAYRRLTRLAGRSHADPSPRQSLA
jgi:hypothetical protein